MRTERAGGRRVATTSATTGARLLHARADRCRQRRRVTLVTDVGGKGATLGAAAELQRFRDDVRR